MSDKFPTDRQYVEIIQEALMRLGQRTTRSLPIQKALIHLMRVFNEELRPAVGLEAIPKDELDLDEIEKSIALLETLQTDSLTSLPGAWVENGALFIDAETLLKSRGIEVTEETVEIIRRELHRMGDERGIPVADIHKGEKSNE